MTDNSYYLLLMKATGSAEQKLAWQFRLYDRDGSGCIDLREMIEILVMILQNDYTRCHFNNKTGKV